MWLALVAAMTVNAQPSAVDAAVQLMTERRQPWARRKQALEQLRHSDAKVVLLAILPWIPPVDRERPAGFVPFAGPRPITDTTPFDEQLSFCMRELVHAFVTEPLPSPDLGRWLVGVLSAPDGEDRFSRLIDAAFRHWVPELEVPVAKVLREGKRLAVRTWAADLLVSQRSATKYLSDVLALIRSQPLAERPKVFLGAFTRNLADATPTTWKEILKEGLSMLRLLATPRHPKAAELAVYLADWLGLKLPRYTVGLDHPVTPEEMEREAEAAVSGVLTWYDQHPNALARGAAKKP